MFSKTWRVHAIFTNIKLNKKVARQKSESRIIIVYVNYFVSENYVKKIDEYRFYTFEIADSSIVKNIECYRD